jgi:hypothetical protein
VPPYLAPVEVAGAVVLVAGAVVVAAGAVVLVAGAAVVVLNVVVGSAWEQALKNKTEINEIAKSVKSHFFIRYTSLKNLFVTQSFVSRLFFAFQPIYTSLI